MKPCFASVFPLTISLLMAAVAPHARAAERDADTPAPALAPTTVPIAAPPTAQVPAPAPPPQRLVVLVDTGSHMPLAEITGGALTGGLHRDVGAAIAERLGRTPQFKVWPRKRIGAALEQGEGDVLCMYMPEWLPGQLHWSVPFVPMTEVVISRRDAPRPLALADLANQQIGTVLGYVYPELEHALGTRFVRADTASGLNSLRKLELGRVRHAETTTLFVDYFMKQGGKLDIHPPLVVKTYRTLCAVSPRGSVAVDDVNRAVGLLLHDGGLARILASYK
ncbi:transporter substrate-binding domain-containing protein [Duganella sp. FT92W]|uniref:Transporter substrate-binding domain-containing protein n=1 Tax=Pseudoduganella rivuli TaxID=2666085 RepID=A0A7X2LVZ6_9BURK|nr:transporter substrate-binding domain-containing protein [Pseudoduganella rivuli]MRV75483.1 transporter substrate-binding domain-containing protein [Pseudoduganella rivuli]